MEELVEEGIVSEVKDGIATVNVYDNAGCKECSAKMFCKTDEADFKILTAKDPFGVNPGDKVRVSVKGSNVVKMTALIYGVPLLILLVSILVGMSVIKDKPELYSTLIGLGLIGLYVAVLMGFLKSRLINSNFIPRIVFVSTSRKN